MSTPTDTYSSASSSASASTILIDPPGLLTSRDAPTVELVLPVHNEQRILEQSVRTLYDYLETHLGCSFQITIADNASTDETLGIAERLAAGLPDVRVLHLERKGRGNALREAWGASRAEVVGYMDIDLSTDLSCLPGLLSPLLESRSDLGIGSRLAPGARVTRGVKRETISRSYNILLRGLLGVGFSDAQCGFKAARREAIAPLLTEVKDDGWFFDTELLYLARRNRLAIHEVPVLWVDDPDSRVAIVATALEDLRGIARLRREARGRSDSPRDQLGPESARGLAELAGQADGRPA
jgi:glycosyltransferase involved in cell wall biosynthesis